MTPTFRYNPAVVAQTFATMACLAPGPRHARRRHGRGAQRGGRRVGGRGRVAGVQGAVRPAARGGAADARAVDRGPGDLRGRVLPHRGRRDLRPPRPAGARVRRRRRPDGGPVCRPRRRRLHLHLGQGAGALRRPARAGRRRGPGQGRPRPRRDRPDDRGQAVVGPRPRAGPGEHPVLGAAVPDRGAEALDPRPRRDGAGRRRAAHRAGGEALGRRLAPRGGRRGAAGLHRPRVRPPRRARPRPRPGALPLAPSPSRCCPACASSPPPPGERRDVPAPGCPAAPAALRLRGRTFDAGRPAVMAIVNRTPDSFWVGQPARRPRARRARALDAAVALGADLVDVGGVRAGQEGDGRHGPSEEIERVVPFLARGPRPAIPTSCSASTPGARRWPGWPPTRPASTSSTTPGQGTTPTSCTSRPQVGAGYVVSHTGGLPPRTDPVGVTYPPEPLGVARRRAAHAARGRRAGRGGRHPGRPACSSTRPSTSARRRRTR